ncbi:MAG: ATP-binding protein, partial [Acinetobacter sp.]
MRNGWLSIFVTLCLCVLSFASSAQTNFAVSPTCKVNVDKISAVKTSSIDVVPKTGWVEVKNPDVWTERWPHYDGGVWYHFNWHWSCNDSNELKQPLAFSVEGMSSAGAVFFNRNLLWKDKHLVEPLSKSWNTPRFWILPVESLKQK